MIIGDLDRDRLQRGRNMENWVIIHWFELSTLSLLCLNLWFVSRVSKVLREVNHRIAFLSSIQGDQTHKPWSE